MKKDTAIRLFENRRVRSIWDADAGKWYISIVDAIGVLTDSDDPRNYWKVLKHRLQAEGNGSVTNCNQLKMQSSEAGHRPLARILSPQRLFAKLDQSAAEIHQHKGLKTESLRDNITNLELVLNMLAEASTTEISQKERPQTTLDNRKVAARGGRVAASARKEFGDPNGRHDRLTAQCKVDKSIERKNE